MIKKIFYCFIIVTLVFVYASCQPSTDRAEKDDATDQVQTGTAEDIEPVVSDTAETDVPPETDGFEEDIVLPTEIIVGKKTYSELVVYNTCPENGYTEKFLRTAELFMGIKAEEGTAEAANLVITNDMTPFSPDAEWAVEIRDDRIYIAGGTRYAVDVAYVAFQDMISEMNGKYVFNEENRVQGALPSKEDYLEKEQLVIYPEFDRRVNRIYDYRVTVSQRNLSAEIPVYNHTMEYALTVRSVGGDVFRRFAYFAFSGEGTRIDIRVGTDFEYYSILPTAKDFDTEYNDGVISVFLDEPEYFAIRLDGNDATILSVLSDYPEFPLEIPEKDDDNVFYIDGWFETDNGLWHINTTYTTVYIAPGAVVNARIKFTDNNFKYSKVIGRGAIIDPYGNLNKTDIRVGGTEGGGYKMVSFAGDYWLYDGPICIDARCFNVIMGGNKGTIRNFKVLASMMNTDGITIGGKNHVVERCYMYVGDNGIVLNGTKDTLFRDITIGTTCAAIFPQGSVTGVELEDIYIFRSNDGIINNFYNSDGTVERTLDISMKNVYCEDCLNLPHFFRGEKMGTLSKFFNFTNVSLPSICGTSDAHDSWMPNTNRLVLMKNSSGAMFTENYTLNFTNLYINGSAVESKSQVVIEDSWKNTYSFENNGEFRPGFCKTYDASYRKEDKVFIGEYEAFFEHDVIRADGKVYIPAREFLDLISCSSKPDTVSFDGIDYVDLEELRKKGIIEDFSEKNSRINLTLPSTNDNILMPEKGEVSHYSEMSSSQVDLVVEEENGEPVYYLHSYKNRYSGGITRFIHNEFKMYGTGTYEFSFAMRGADEGKIITSHMYDTIMESTSRSEEIDASRDWTNYKIFIEITPDILMCESYYILIRGVSETPMNYFAVKDFCLKKIS